MYAEFTNKEQPVVMQVKDNTLFSLSIFHWFCVHSSSITCEYIQTTSDIWLFFFQQNETVHNSRMSNKPSYFMHNFLLNFSLLGIKAMCRADVTCMKNINVI